MTLARFFISQVLNKNNISALQRYRKHNWPIKHWFRYIILSLHGMRVTILLSLLFLFCAVPALAQNQTMTEGEGAETSPKDQSASVVVPIKSEIKCWNLDKQNSATKSVFVDSSMTNFHIYNPMYKQNVSTTFLGYLGAPFISNSFFDRENNSGYYFMRPFEAYHRSQNEVEYFNTTTPFSYLMYQQGDQSDSKYEQSFKAFFTQNIDSVTNFGFLFSTIRNQGQYQLQQSKHNFLNFFVSRNSERYNGYFSLISAGNIVTENGGIKESFVDTRYAPWNLYVNMTSGLETSIKTFSVFTSHEYLLGGLDQFFKKDTIDSVGFVPRFGVQYSAQFDNYKRLSTESSINTSFFDNFYFKSKGSSIDSSSFLKFDQILQLKAFERKDSKFTFGKRAFIENEIISAKHPVAYGMRTYNYSNVLVGGEIYRSEGEFWKWSALAKFTLLGRNLGDAIVKGTIEKPLRIFSDTTNFVVEGWYQDQSADIYQEHWQDNHFKWERNFNKQHEVVVKGSFSYPRFNLTMGAGYILLSNYLYNNQFALPDQYNNEFSVVNYWLNKEFKLGHFGWSNKVIFQETTDNAVLHLPAISYYTSVYFSSVLFKVMSFQLGAEMYYNTKFFADKYEPSTSRFYIQDDVLTGGYPLVNLFANAKLKRTNAFALLYHANSRFMDGSFFSSPGYPLNQMAFRFGFYWTFYD